MSGFVEDGVIVARLAWLRIGAIALPEPLISGPIAATTLGSATILRALVAACAGSYWPAVVVPSSSTMMLILQPATIPLTSSTAIIAPSLIWVAASASEPVNGTLMPIVTLLSAAKVMRDRTLPASAAAGRWTTRARRVIIVSISLVKPM